MEDKVVVLGAAGGRAEVSGQQLWQREGLGAEAVQLHSHPSSLATFLSRWAGPRRMGFASVSPPLALWWGWAVRAPR